VRKIVADAQGGGNRSIRVESPVPHQFDFAGGGSVSHNLSCPTDWEIRSAARRDAESGYRRDRWSEDCPESQEEYRRQYRSAEYRIEEQRAEEEQRQYYERIAHEQEREEAEAEQARQDQYWREDQRWLDSIEAQMRAEATVEPELAPDTEGRSGQ
jgi:hypothetical protein